MAGSAHRAPGDASSYAHRDGQPDSNCAPTPTATETATATATPTETATATDNRKQVAFEHLHPWLPSRNRAGSHVIFQRARCVIMKNGDASSPQTKQKIVWRYRMRYTKSWLIIMLALSLILSACNFGQEPEPTPDVDAIFTAAAETVWQSSPWNLPRLPWQRPQPRSAPTNTPPPTFEIENPGAGSPADPGTHPLQPLGLEHNLSRYPAATITSAARGHPSWPGMHELSIYCRRHLP
jgi:hypothetical protein